MSDSRRNEPPPLGPVDSQKDLRQSRWSQIAEPLDALQRWLPADPLQEGSQLQSSDSIRVDHYELTLLWPLLLRECGGVSRRAQGVPDPDRLERWAQTIERDGVWEETDSTDLSSETGYSEFLYFHPFVRNFLYPNRNDLKRGTPPRSSGLRVFCRPDIRTIAAEVYVDPNHSERYVLDARRVELYVFATSVAILAVHLTPAAREPAWSLAQVLRLQDVLRRLHAPYWESPEPVHFAGHCPLSIEIVSGRGDAQDTVWHANFGGFGQADAWDSTGRRAVAEQLDNVARHREPLPVLPWRKLIEPLEPVTATEPEQSCLQYVQIEDERMQVLSYLAVSDPRAISAGDWVRLATVDESGDSRLHPYSPGFLKGSGLAGDGFRGFAYDRFWDPQGAPPANYDLTSTRWLCCGYGFTAVGSSTSPFFTDDSAGALAHFRHHYFKLALIAHFHRASLLGFKQMLSSMLDARRDSADDADSAETRFSRDLIALREEFLSFRNRYWFIEVSNQIQGRELFDLWAHHLNTRSLFADVAAEIHEATDVRQAERLEKSVDQIAEMQTNIEWVELFIVGAYALELVHVAPEVLKGDDPPFRIVAVGVVLTTIGLVAWAIRPWHHERTRRRKVIIAILGLVVLLFGAYVWWFPPATQKRSGHARAATGHEVASDPIGERSNSETVTSGEKDETSPHTDTQSAPTSRSEIAP